MQAYQNIFTLILLVNKELFLTTIKVLQIVNHNNTLIVFIHNTQLKGISLKYDRFKITIKVYQNNKIITL